MEGTEQDWIKAGQLTGKALLYGKKFIKVDASYMEVLDKVEDFIIKEGGQIAFPAQLSFNHIAAH